MSTAGFFSPEEQKSATENRSTGRYMSQYTGVKNIASMAIMSHKDCGLDYSPMSQMVRSHVKKLANEIDVLDQSEEGLHQRKGNTKNRFSKCDEWD